MMQADLHVMMEAIVTALHTTVNDTGKGGARAHTQENTRCCLLAAAAY